MRQIGTLPKEPDAHRLAAYLVTQGVEAHAESDGEGWAIWVRDENDVESAKELFEQFRVDPSDPRYRGAERTAESIQREKEKERRRAAENVVEIRGRWRQGAARKAPLTLTLIALSVLVAIATNFGDDKNGKLARLLMFCDPVHHGEGDWSNNSVPDRFVDIRHGQIWRLVTPIFLHWGIVHLIFNMYWTFHFGSQIEDRKGTLLLGFIVLAAAVVPNTAEVLVSNPWLGGMSGVGYALFGYAGMKTLYDPGAGIRVTRPIAIMFIVWFFICMSGHIGNVANVAHGVGLAVGVVIGYAPVLWRPPKGR
jgi:GlpG protein